MSIILYSKYRRLGLRKSAELSGIKSDAAYVAAGIATIFLAYLLVGWIDAIAEEADRRILAEKKFIQMENVWLSCLNGNGASIDGVLHICKPTNTHIKVK